LVSPKLADQGQGHAKITFCVNPPLWVVDPGDHEVVCLLPHCGQRVRGSRGAHPAATRSG